MHCLSPMIKLYSLVSGRRAVQISLAILIILRFFVVFFSRFRQIPVQYLDYVLPASFPYPLYFIILQLSSY